TSQLPGSLPITGVGLPHSGTPGSTPARGSPGRIVVRHALRRLAAPRHPPIALIRLITEIVVLHEVARASPATGPLCPRKGEKPAPGPTQATKRPCMTNSGFPSISICSFQGARSGNEPGHPRCCCHRAIFGADDDLTTGSTSGQDFAQLI